MRRTANFERFNASQRHALDTERNLAVRANAGSGKTSVIVERIVQLLAKSWDEGTPLGLSALVAITFTRKAAGELQERLAESFRPLAQSAPDPREQAYWSGLLEELPRAMVGTIDSFCGRILREFGLVETGLGRVEPDFEPLEGYGEEVLKRDAINRVLNRLSALSLQDAGAEEYAQVEACHWWAVEEGYAALIEHLETLLNHFLDPETMIQAHRSLEPAVRRVERAWTALPAVQRLQRERGVLQEQLAALWRAIAERKKVGVTLTELRDSLSTVLEALAVGDRAADAQALACLTDALLTERGTPRKKGLDALAELVVPLQEVWGPLLVPVKEFDYEGERRALEASDRLVRLLEPVHAQYLWLCQAANRFDYLTLARRTRNLLKTHPEVRAALKERYRYVMLDEFQDTNDLQWEIIAWLVGSGPEGPLDPDRLFLVGDPQQSIYRFRHADVSVFRRVQEHLRASNEFHGHGSRPTEYDALGANTPATAEQRLGLMPLAENYRSLSPLPLALMDRVFRYVFDAEAHGLDLEQNAFEIRYQPLEAGLRVPDPAAVGEVRYLVPLEPEEGADEEESEPEENSAAGDGLGSAQVQAVVDQLVSLHGRPRYTAREGEAKTLDWYDMAVLLPSRSTVLTELEKELRLRGVPFVVTKGIGFWQRQEVRDVINLAACLADFGDELALFAVLRSPLGQLNDTEILFLSQLGLGSLIRGLDQVRFAGADLSLPLPTAGDQRRWISERWQNMPAPLRAALMQVWQTFSAETQERLRQTADHLGDRPLGRWRQRVDRMAHADLLQRCLEESGAYAIYAAEAEGDVMLANLERLFGRIRTEDGNSTPGLARLARWLQEQMGNALKEEQATLPTGSNAVQIMTVHAAKGLEFPVVAVMKMERQVDRRSNARLLVKNIGEHLLAEDAALLAEPPPGTVAVRVRHPRRPRENYSPRLLRALQRLDQAQQLAESRRLFYVAGTRAKERLILAGRQLRRGRHAESWQKWFEDALGLTAEDLARRVWQDTPRRQTVQIITGISSRQPIGQAKATLPDTQLALDALQEHSQAPLLPLTQVEALRQRWKEDRWQWWLQARAQLDPGAASPGFGLVSDTAPAQGLERCTVIGTLVQRLFELAPPGQPHRRERLRPLLEAMATGVLLTRSAHESGSEEETPRGADPEMVRQVVDMAERIGERLHAEAAGTEQLRSLLEAAGACEVPFVLRLGRWQIMGRYDKLLALQGRCEIVYWQDETEENGMASAPSPGLSLRLAALALYRAGLANLVDGTVGLHRVLLPSLRVEALTFSAVELEAFAAELEAEFQQMDAYKPS